MSPADLALRGKIIGSWIKANSGTVFRFYEDKSVSTQKLNGDEVRDSKWEIRDGTNGTIIMILSDKQVLLKLINTGLLEGEAPWKLKKMK